MNPQDQLVVFSLDEQRYALHLAAVDRVVMVAEVTALPKAPQIVSGVVNVQGRVLPAIDIRKRFNLPAQETRLSDHMIIAKTARRSVVIVVDGVSGVIERSQAETTDAGGILPGLPYLQGVVKLEDGLILIHDLETFLSLEEEKELDEALAQT